MKRFMLTDPTRAYPLPFNEEHIALYREQFRGIRLFSEWGMPYWLDWGRDPDQARRNGLFFMALGHKVEDDVNVARAYAMFNSKNELLISRFTQGGRGDEELFKTLPIARWEYQAH